MPRSIGPLHRLKLGCLDVPDLPSTLEGVSDFLLGNPPRPLVSRLFVREAEEVQQSTMPMDFSQPADEHRTFFVGKGVEQPTVDHGVELPSQLVQLECVGNEKMSGTPSLSGFGLGSLDGNGHEVEPPRYVAPGCQIEKVLTGAAAHVENTAANLAASANLTIAGCGLPVSHGAWP